MERSARNRAQHGGFTVLEASVASSLTVFLAILVSSAWSNLGRPLVDAQAGCEITEQANQAAMYLAADLGGQLGSEIIGTKTRGRKNGRFIVGTSELRLCYDGGANPNGIADWASPDTVVVYSVDGDDLIREDERLNTTVTVARHVEQLVIVPQGTDLEVRLTFNYRGIRRTYTFIAKDT